MIAGLHVHKSCAIDSHVGLGIYGGRPTRYLVAHALRASGSAQRIIDISRLPRSTRRLKAVPADVASSPNATWVYLAHVGEWRGHHSGEFAFTREIFDQIVANFERQQTPVPFKYEHPVGMGQPLPSAGKIYNMRVDEAGVLWAFTLFTDRAASMIRAREYEYCSVVVVFNSLDRVTGESIGAELIEVGLTDTPFIDGQRPIRLESE